MTAPLRTAGQFLTESGFGNGAVDYQSFPEFPDLNTQLQALRKLDPKAPEIPWVEYALSAARQARLDDDRGRETAELQNARKAIERSFKRRTPAAEWPKMAVVLAAIALIGVLVWMDRRKKSRRRRQNVPLSDDTYDPGNDPHALPDEGDTDTHEYADDEDEDDG
jgi:hypothetical protein